MPNSTLLLIMTFCSGPMPEYMGALLGLPLSPSFVPAVFGNDRVSDHMTLCQRFQNLLRSWSNYYAFTTALHNIDAVFRKRW